MRPVRLALLVPWLALAALCFSCRDGRETGFITGSGAIASGLAECSSWFVRSDAGGTFELTALPKDLQQQGLRVRFVLRRRDDLASICMVGPIVDVVSMTRE